MKPQFGNAHFIIGLSRDTGELHGFSVGITTRQIKSLITCFIRSVPCSLNLFGHYALK